MNADEGKSTKDMLCGGAVDRNSFGLLWIMMNIPIWAKKILSPIIGLKVISNSHQKDDKHINTTSSEQYSFI